MEGVELNREGLSYVDQVKYGLIGIISLGSIASCELEKIDFIESNNVLTYSSYNDIDQKSIKQLCDVSDVIFLVVNLDDISVGKSIWGLISYLKSMESHIIVIANTSQISTNLAATLQKKVPFLDLYKQENSDMLWTLKTLHSIHYYYNDEYNWSDGNYPPSMFWDNFFNINSEIFIFQGDNATSFLETIYKNKHLNKRLIMTKHCILRGPNNIVSEELEVLDNALGNDDTDFYCREKKINDLLLLISV